MGQPLSRQLAVVLDREQLEASVIAPAFRKIFRSWNSTDLWTALRRYWNEFPRRPKYLGYSDVAHIIGAALDESEVLFVWDTFSVPANTVLASVN